MGLAVLALTLVSNTRLLAPWYWDATVATLKLECGFLRAHRLWWIAGEHTSL